MAAPSIPPPRLQRVRNQTPLPHFQFDKMGKGQRFHDVVIACGSFVLAPGVLQLAAVQRGPVFADVPWAPERAALSSLREATDVLLTKPGADVYVTGAARALDWTPRPAWEASLRVDRQGEALVDKTLRLTGPRQWLWHDDPAGRRLGRPRTRRRGTAALRARARRLVVRRRRCRQRRAARACAQPVGHRLLRLGLP